MDVSFRAAAEPLQRVLVALAALAVGFLIGLERERAEVRKALALLA